MFVTSVSIVTAVATKKQVPVDLLNDLSPVALLSTCPLVIVTTPDSKIHTPQDLVAAARAHPDAITNGTPGIGTIGQMAAELLNRTADIRIKNIPYTGGAPALIDLLGGRTDINIVSNSQTASAVSAGKLREVAITWSKPSANFPGIPTMASAVPGYEVDQWTAVWAPSGTPSTIIDRLNREINAIIKTPEFALILRDDGGTAQPSTPAEADAKVRASYKMWHELAAAKNLMID